MASIASLLTCTRATPVAAYYLNADLTLSTFAANTLRYGTSGLLVEGARTNLILRSQEAGTTWNNAQTTVTADAIAAPDGTATADLLTETVADNLTSRTQTVTVSSGVNIAVSNYFKRGNHDWLRVVLFAQNFSEGFGAWFNLGTGAAGSSVTFGASTVTAVYIEALANGWYRCTVVGVFASETAALYFECSATADNSSSRAAAATRYVWGTQLETATGNAKPSSYIPTTSASVTRAADIVTFSDVTWLNGTGDSIYAEWTAVGAAGTVMVLDTANDTTLAEATGAAKISDAATFAITTGNTATTATTAKAAARMATNDIALCLNAGTVGTDTSATQPGTLAAARLGVDLAGANPLNGYIRRIAAFKGTSLTNGALQTLST